MQNVDPQTLIPGETYYLIPKSDYLYSKYRTLARGIFNNL